MHQLAGEGRTLHLLTVVVTSGYSHVNLSDMGGSGCDEATLSTGVYALTPGDIAHATGDGPKPARILRDGVDEARIVPLLAKVTPYERWAEAGGWAGNEANPRSINSLYLQRLVLAVPK